MTAAAPPKRRRAGQTARATGPDHAAPAGDPALDDEAVYRAAGLEPPAAQAVAA